VCVCVCVCSTVGKVRRRIGVGGGKKGSGIVAY